MSQLVLSSTTTFFTGRLESVFKKAKKHGIKYLEILPYRWTTAEQVLRLEKKYDITVAGLHLPLWWERPHGANTATLFAWLHTLVMQIYLGPAITSPAFAIAEAMRPRAPYLLIHADLIPDMAGKFEELKNKFNVTVENIHYVPGDPEYFWNITKLSQIAPLVFDPGHYRPRPEIYQAYGESSPDIFHISYEHAFPYFHDLPNAEEREEMRKLFQIHPPKYIVIETYPWVSVEKAVALLQKMVFDPPLQTLRVEPELPAVDPV